MNPLPIVDRELRVTARRPATYRLRCVLILASFALWAVLLLTGQTGATPARLSQQVFGLLSSLAFGFSLFAGLFFTADCLSSEKRTGTLGLLFLTDLKGYDVVLGKLAATSLHAFYGLLAVFPILALPLLMGGVAPGEFGRVVLVLLVVLGQSLSLALLISAISRETRQALLGVLLALVVLAGILPILWWIQFALFKNRFGDTLLLLSPGYALRLAFDAVYRTARGAAQFWTSVAVMAVMGGTALALACVLLARVWREQPSKRKAGGWANHWREKRFGNAAERLALRRQELDRNPYGWLTLRDALSRVLTYPCLGLIVPLWSICLFRALTTPNPATMRVLFILSMFTAYGMHQLIKVMVTIEATRQLTEDNQTGSLELILTTPLTPRSIWEGVRNSLRAHFKSALRWVSVMNLLLLASVFFCSRQLSVSDRERFIFCELFAGGWLMLYLDFRALSWAGIAAALKTPRQHQAILRALARVMVPAWLAICLIFLIATSRNIRQETFNVLFAAWFGFGILNDWIAGFRARQWLARYVERGPRGPIDHGI